MNENDRFCIELARVRLKRYLNLERTFKGVPLSQFSKTELMALVALIYDINGWKSLKEVNPKCNCRSYYERTGEHIKDCPRHGLEV